MHADAAGIAGGTEPQRKLHRLDESEAPDNSRYVRDVNLRQRRNAAELDVAPHRPGPEQNGDIVLCQQFACEVIREAGAERVDGEALERLDRARLPEAAKIGIDQLLNKSVAHARKIGPGKHLIGVAAARRSNQAGERSECHTCINEQAQRQDGERGDKPLHAGPTRIGTRRSNIMRLRA